jgi:hypothetical protein
MSSITNKADFLAWAAQRLSKRMKPVTAYRLLRNQARRVDPKLHWQLKLLVDDELVHSALDGSQSTQTKDQLLSELAVWWDEAMRSST